MVRYYGRARQRVGSVNTNQIGLKMSGCVSKVGRSGVIDRYISRRSQCNQKFCGPVFYHGQLWSWNNQRCVPRVPRSQSFNSGVGHINSPRFLCERTCSVNIDPDTACQILKKYFDHDGYTVALAIRKQDCPKSGMVALCNQLQTNSGWDTIVPDTDAYNKLPVHVQNAVDVINNIRYRAPLTIGGEPLLHVVTRISDNNRNTLLFNEYGFPVKLGICSLTAYGKNDLGCNTSDTTSKKKFKDNSKPNTKVEYIEPGTLFWAIAIWVKHQMPDPTPTNISNYNQLIKCYGDISDWDTSQITDMSWLFSRDQWIDQIETSGIPELEGIGQWISKHFNADLSKWNTSKVTNMDTMFG